MEDWPRNVFRGLFLGCLLFRWGPPLVWLASAAVDLGFLKGSAFIVPQDKLQHKSVLPCGTDTLKAILPVVFKVIDSAFTWSLLRFVRVSINFSTCSVVWLEATPVTNICSNVGASSSGARGASGTRGASVAVGAGVGCRGGEAVGVPGGGVVSSAGAGVWAAVVSCVRCSVSGEGDTVAGAVSWLEPDVG